MLRRTYTIKFILFKASELYYFSEHDYEIIKLVESYLTIKTYQTMTLKLQQ